MILHPSVRLIGLGAVGTALIDGMALTPVQFAVVVRKRDG